MAIYLLTSGEYSDYGVEDLVETEASEEEVRAAVDACDQAWANWRRLRSTSVAAIAGPWRRDPEYFATYNAACKSYDLSNPPPSLMDEFVKARIADFRLLPYKEIHRDHTDGPW